MQRSLTKEELSMASPLLHGPPGHPIHPPLTDVAIGAYTVATAFFVLGALGIAEDAMGKAAWLGLLGGLAGSLLSAVTGIADLLRIDRDSPTFRAGTIHGAVMATGTVLFALAAIFQYDGFHDGRVTGAGLVFCLAGFAALSIGGFLGGGLVFRHGVRVEPDSRSRDAS